MKRNDNGRKVQKWSELNLMAKDMFAMKKIKSYIVLVARK
jgi:hypothetical protein